ncbi:hypothetical protein BGZ83_011151 [Gryganskiella cystojenkinii]|nr:hypothetical protein BGZ83_011151 [Gryganskiella cystojenkinii]
MLSNQTSAPEQKSSPADGSTHKPGYTLWPVKKDSTVYEFPVKGKGTISFTFNTENPFQIVLAQSKNQGKLDGTKLVLEVGLDQTALWSDNGKSSPRVIAKTEEKRALVEKGIEISYWMSLDYMNARVRFGKGEMLPQLVVFEALLPIEHDETAKGRRALPIYKELRYVEIAFRDGMTPKDLDHQLWRLPVITALPPLLVPSDRITMDMIALNKATVVTSLPDACQILYGNVAGPDIKLDTPDFPDFSAAINYSIMTPGCICYNKLREKANSKEFGNYELEKTYLRITLGPNQGDSPGSPYVLEIWPGGHYSPVHDHGDTCAVIKVLHGDIWVELYAALQPGDIKPHTEAVFYKDEVTYLTPELYQVHKLVNRNPPGNMTATIQCYQYPDDDTVHWESFDYYVGENKQRSEPGSDWEFIYFRALIRAEWGFKNSK